MKWNMEIGSNWDYDQLNTFHISIRSITNTTKMRDFQYRFLQRGLITNVHLHKWKIAESDQCSFCHDSVETIAHLFIECPITKSMWKGF